MSLSFWEQKIKGGVVLSKQRTRTLGNLPNSSKEAVFKIVSYGKSQRAIVATASYIAEHSEGLFERCKLETNEGEISKDEIWKKLKDWELPSDKDNLKEGYSLNDKYIDEKKAFKERHTVHFVISLPKGVGNVEKLNNMTRDILEPFKQNGHEFVFGTHQHQGALHSHVVLKLRNNEGKKIRFDKERLQEMREWQVEVAKKHGIELEATRVKEMANYIIKKKTKLDDKELEILKSEREKLKKRLNKIRIWNYNGEKSTLNKIKAIDEALRKNSKKQEPLKAKTLLERQVENWYNRNGLQWEARRLDNPSLKLEALRIKLPELEKREEEQLEKWGAAFVEPQKAVQRLKEMLAENQKTAFFYANKRPEIFEALKDKNKQPSKIYGNQIKIKKKWQEEALKTIKESTFKESDLRKKAKEQLLDNIRLKEGEVKEKEARARLEKEGVLEKERVERKEKEIFEKKSIFGKKIIEITKIDYSFFTDKEKENLYIKNLPIFKERYGDNLKAIAEGDWKEPAKHLKLPPLGKKDEVTLEKWGAAFVEPQKAVQRLKEILAENKNQAFILLNKQKLEVFGELKPYIDKEKSRERLTIDNKDLNITPEWQNKVLDKISKEVKLELLEEIEKAKERNTPYLQKVTPAFYERNCKKGFVQFVEMPKLDEKSEQTLEKWGAAFVEPQKAVQRLKEMLAENKNQAIKSSFNDPSVFGKLKANVSISDLKLDIEVSSEWKKKAFQEVLKTLPENNKAVVEYKKQEAVNKILKSKDRNLSEEDKTLLREESEKLKKIIFFFEERGDAGNWAQKKKDQIDIILSAERVKEIKEGNFDKLSSSDVELLKQESRLLADKITYFEDKDLKGNWASEQKDRIDRLIEGYQEEQRHKKEAIEQEEKPKEEVRKTKKVEKKEGIIGKIKKIFAKEPEPEKEVLQDAFKGQKRVLDVADFSSHKKDESKSKTKEKDIDIDRER
ncbi:MAG: relaxase/mobilization nuclease domain-containing protein [Bacilli bacterium]